MKDKNGNIGSPKKSNYISGTLPSKVTSKSSAQFVYKTVPQPQKKKTLGMLARGMKKLSNNA